MRALPLALVVFAVAVATLAPSRADAQGLLLPTRGGDPLAIRRHSVDVNVRERVAETRIEQTFLNQSPMTLEATYVFPVPEGASVDGFAMWVGGRRQEGEVLEAQQARRIYEEIVARVRDPGLVEHMGGRLFRARVFPIAPNAEQRVELRFSQTLPYEDSVVHYTYPLRTDGPAARTLEGMNVTVRIASRTPIRAVYSPSHSIQVTRPDDRHAVAAFEGGPQPLDRDFELFYAVQDRDVGLSLISHRPAGDDGWFLAMIAPRTEITEREIAAKEVLFVFDTSGSMAGEKIARAQAALDYMLARLNPDDRFQVIRFSTDVEVLFQDAGSVAATQDNVARARGFAQRFIAAGGTAIEPALTEALRRPRAAANLPRLVVFLTDGMPTIGETIPQRILESTARVAPPSSARVFVFGVGDDVNTTFLDALARQHGGAGDYFRDGAEMERRMSAFYDRIAYPLFADLELSFPGLEVYDVYPRDLGHLYKGDQLLVVGRYRGAREQGTVRLTGRASHETTPRSFEFPVRFAAREDDNEFLPRLWATRKVGFLLDAIRLRGETSELRDEVVALGRRYGIVTPYTSYLVVEEDAVPEPLARRPMLPQQPLPFANQQVPIDRRVGGGGGAGLRSAGEPAASRPFDGFDQAVGAFRMAEEEDADDEGAGRARGGSGSRAVRAAPPPRPMTSATSSAPSGGMGERGRAISRQLREMREAQRSDVAGSDVRYASGRSLRHVSGAWVDAEYRRGMRELRLRWGSPAYFALLRARGDLRAALALGTHVAVVLPGGRAVVVTPDGPEGVSEAEVARFLGD